MKSSRFFLGTTLVLFGVLACSLQGGPSAGQPDLAATITAQYLTLQAPIATAATATGAGSSAVEVSVTSDTNCRTGPSQDFDRVFVAHPSQSFKVVGKNTSTNYWIITDPSGGTCWLWGQYAILTGDPSTLPEYPKPAQPNPGPTKTPKPTKTPQQSASATPAAPAAPGGMAYERTCEMYIASDGFTPKWSEAISLTWQDNATNETGYRLYKNGSPLPVLPPDSTAYHITERYNTGTGGTLFIAFKVEAFNNYGTSDPTGLDVPKCP